MANSRRAIRLLREPGPGRRTLGGGPYPASLARTVRRHRLREAGRAAGLDVAVAVAWSAVVVGVRVPPVLLGNTVGGARGGRRGRRRVAHRLGSRGRRRGSGRLAHRLESRGRRRSSRRLVHRLGSRRRCRRVAHRLASRGLRFTRGPWRRSPSNSRVRPLGCRRGGYRSCGCGSVASGLARAAAARAEYDHERGYPDNGEREQPRERLSRTAFGVSALCHDAHWFPSPSLGAPLLSVSWSPPLRCGMPAWWRWGWCVRWWW